MKALRSILKTSIERGVSMLPRRAAAGNRLIIAYHNIIPASAPALGDVSLHLSESAFELELSILKKEGDIVPLDILLSAPDRKSNLLAITFDDAYTGCLSLGVKRCIAWGLPATVFVAPGLLGRLPLWDVRAAYKQWSRADRDTHLWTNKGMPAWDDSIHSLSGLSASLYRIGTEAELREVAESSLVTFGSHTFNHVNLGALEGKAAVDEIKSSHSWLNERFPDRLSATLAYPYGIPPRNAEEVLACTPISYGLRVEGGWFTGSHFDWAAVPRLNVPGKLSASGFRARVRGWMSS